MPLFKHDCPGCRYLGSDDANDYYWCGQGGLMETVIARFANEGHQYESGMACAREQEARGMDSPLVRALRLAREQGFVTY